MRYEIDLKPLFESKLCTQSLCDGAIKHWKNFPEFHASNKTITVPFNESISTLRFSPTIYDDHFRGLLKHSAR